jgi:hypothetical protein
MREPKGPRRVIVILPDNSSFVCERTMPEEPQAAEPGSEILKTPVKPERSAPAEELR